MILCGLSSRGNEPESVLLFSLDTIERKQASQFTWFKPALSKPVTNPKPQDEYLAEDVGGPTLKYAEPYGIGFQPNNGTIV
ncbi:gp41 [Erwinia phage vB_EamM-Y2]|uniref:Gp41 n=1 Tax=Erwinia phage vB_EamM-Y2 TaxID=1051676 RepID=G0YPZ0_9CAUD|nr:gp41 [Erwinia phage vB_EamM-Y2]AEJ81417.1 gp41 [Erwinia phage vB_EamM-Y2]